MSLSPHSRAKGPRGPRAHTQTHSLTHHTKRIWLKKRKRRKVQEKNSHKNQHERTRIMTFYSPWFQKAAALTHDKAALCARSTRRPDEIDMSWVLNLPVKPETVYCLNNPLKKQSDRSLPHRECTLRNVPNGF